MSKNYWEKIYKTEEFILNRETEWLDRYEDIFSEKPDKPVIDLGCGTGTDSLYLIEQGCRVISCDFSDEALKKLSSVDSRITTRQFNLSDGLPFEKASAHVVLASLSLHYFNWDTSMKIAADIAGVLDCDGVLICRLNSVNDKNHGAGEGIEIEKNYYNINGNHKRFFDRTSIENLFTDWDILVAEERDIGRYRLPKRAWEVVVKKNNQEESNRQTGNAL